MSSQLGGPGAERAAGLGAADIGVEHQAAGTDAALGGVEFAASHASRAWQRGVSRILNGRLRLGKGRVQVARAGRYDRFGVTQRPEVERERTTHPLGESSERPPRCRLVPRPLRNPPDEDGGGSAGPFEQHGVSRAWLDVEDCAGNPLGETQSVLGRGNRVSATVDNECGRPDATQIASATEAERRIVCQ